MTATVSNARLETFCDGVFAIALTLLVIELRPPPADEIENTRDLWIALQHLAPLALAFILSFVVVFITMVNHHGALRLIHKSSAPFVYANGFLLLTVVVIPFPTAMLGEYWWTDHAAPAMVLYDAVLALQAIGWILLGTTALNDGLVRDERCAQIVRENRVHGYYGFALYAGLAVLAIWWPGVVAVVTGVTWLFWLIRSIGLD